MLRATSIALMLATSLCSTAWSQDGAAEKAGAEKATGQAADQSNKRYKAFEELLSGSRMVGQFTVVGRDNPPPKEEYEIQSIKKLPEGDYWQFNARLKYGKTDIVVPLKLEVKWAGDTPVITLTDFTIPGLGTFSSRVMFYNKKYAGTWTHGKAGGHMFGVIEKLPKPDAP
jgi:hypothetical protein